MGTTAFLPEGPSAAAASVRGAAIAEEAPKGIGSIGRKEQIAHEPEGGNAEHNIVDRADGSQTEYIEGTFSG